MSIEEKSSKKILKATLEAVFQSQERLRKHLDRLVEENRPIKDNNERDLFFRELTYSTLGLGKDFTVSYPVPGGYLGLNKDMETVGRWLGYIDTKIVWVPSVLYDDIRRRPEDKDVEIRFLWRWFQEKCFTVFGIAVDRATSLSKEQPEQSKSRGFQIEND